MDPLAIIKTLVEEIGPVVLDVLERKHPELDVSTLRDVARTIDASRAEALRRERASGGGS